MSRPAVAVSAVEAVLRAVEAGILPADVALLFASRRGIRALEIAESLGVPTLILEPSAFPTLDAWDAALARELLERGIEVMLLAGYLRKLGSRTLSALDGRILNTHPGLLPAYGGRGMHGDAVHEAVLADGATQSGATIHVVDADYDTGPVIAQRRVPVLPDDTVGSLGDRVQAAERELVVDTLARLARATGEHGAAGVSASMDRRSLVE
ncbi:MAG: phosphoribosylglycinamide formyltransferase [Actinobacteria bacterium]|nr:phosphoribosylglycinamide formyltransferase [Actinomycetota bacterium]